MASGLLWLLAILAPLLYLQRRLHRELQAVLLLLTRRADVALVLFSLLLFPGILLHELSHFIVARLSGVRTGRLSLIPQRMPDGRLQLGYVETSSTDRLRDSLIGVAPLVSGCLFVAYAGFDRLKLVGVWNALVGGEGAGLLTAIQAGLHAPDFWVWFYLTLAISATMFPSQSDRRSWLPVLLVCLVLVGLAALTGQGWSLLARLSPLVDQGLRSLASVLAVSLGTHLALVLPFTLLRMALARMTGMRVVDLH